MYVKIPAWKRCVDTYAIVVNPEQRPVQASLDVYQ
jgi:hypothetical protein